MTDSTRTRPSLETLDAYADRNGQNLGTDSPLDVGLPSRTQADLKSDPGGEAETARIASGLPGQDAVEQTEAETPGETLRRISDPSSAPAAADAPAGAVEEAIERATASVGQEDGQEDSQEASRRGARHGK